MNSTMLQHQEVANVDSAESRSSADGITAVLLDQATVGGRHENESRAERGGGYQSIYTKTGAAVPAGGVDKLRRIGLARIWIDVAHKVTFDTFLHAWRVMDTHDSLDVDRRIVVPIFRTSNPLAQLWVDLADELGMNTFLRIWRVMEGHDSLDTRGRVVVPVYRAYERFERNEYIRALIGAGCEDRAIMLEVKRTFGEVLSRRSLLRLRGPRKIAA